MTAIVTDTHYRMAVALIRDLGEAGVRVIACDFDDISEDPGAVSRYVSSRVRIRRQSAVGDIEALCRSVCETDGIAPALLPVGSRTQAQLAAASERLEKCAGLLLPTPRQLDRWNDKSAVAQIASELGILVPRDFDPASAKPEYPAIVKPACGEKFGLSAAARYLIVHDRAELDRAVIHFRDITGETPIIQEYLTGGAAGCSILCDRGHVAAHICHRRVREYPVSGGPSSCCEVIEDDRLLDAARRMAEEAGYTGVAMIEFKAGDDGEWRLLEINPRVWGTYPLVRASGSNFSYMWFALAARLEVPEYSAPKPIRMVYYPSDMAACLGYLKRGDFGRFFGGISDFFSPSVKNGLRDREDSEPYREYLRSLRHRR